jgi:hypothetical protein
MQMKGVAVRKAGFIIARMSFGVVAAGMLAAATLAAPAAGATSGTCPSSAKCFAVTVSPASAVAGANTSFAFAITNEAAPQQLGAVRISAPAGFVITGAPGSASFTSSSALFLNLSLAPSATTTLTLSATGACSSGSYQWGVEAKQSNDFSGTGNDFQLDPASVGNLSGTQTGSCSLAFTSDGQPAGTAANAVITSAFGSQGGPVKVEILDGSGQLATGSTAAVTVAIGSNPGSGSLSGMVTVNASGGIASFSNLSINQPGLGYTLIATSPGITSATSDPFNISGVIQPCSGSSCSASASSITTSGTVTTSPTTSGEFLAAGIGGVSYSCAGPYQRVSDPFSFGLFNSSGVADPNARFTVMLQIDKSAVLASGRTGASQWQICYASTQPFTALPGTSGTAVIGGVTFNTGLLPDCSSSQGAPCVQARHKDNAGDVVVTFLATGDPVGWG